MFASNHVAKVLDTSSRVWTSVLCPQDRPLEFIKLEAGIIHDLPADRNIGEELIDDLVFRPRTVPRSSNNRSLAFQILD